jgi:hypothetical protein
VAAAAAVRGGPRASASQIWNGAVGLLVVAALIVQAVLNVQATNGVPMATRFIRLFSFFTVQSNVTVAVAAFSLAMAPARDGRPRRAPLASRRAAPGAASCPPCCPARGRRRTC